MKIFDVLKNIVKIFPNKANSSCGSIVSGDDLDNYHTNGWYWVRNDSGTVIDNRPVESYGLLEIVNFVGTTNALQRFTVFNSPDVYQRMYANSKWYEWRQIAGFGTQTTVTGTMTTKAWANPDSAVTWTAPKDGIYLISMHIVTQNDTAYASTYKMFRWFGTATALLEVSGLYYRGTTDGAQYGINGHAWTFPVKALKGQTVRPCVWIGTAGIVFNVQTTGIHIGPYV